MAVSEAAGLNPVLAFAAVGALGVGSQWLAWRLRMPAIVLMLAAGLIVGPGLGLLDPRAQIGDLLQPMIAVAVAIILFEGGFTLDFAKLKDAATGVRRLVFVGAPLGWLLSSLALHLVAGLGWPASTVFGGIMIVTGPTVIAPLLRQARLAKRPAALLQWEAIVNDPVGALAAVLAFEIVIVLQTATSAAEAIWQVTLGIAWATALGLAGGLGISHTFRRGQVPEYMKVPVLVVAVLSVFALADTMLHESGLLAVTIMGIWIANARLPSYTEMRRFKEHASVLLVSAVFILLAASTEFEALTGLDLRDLLAVLAVILVARPVSVLAALLFSGLPWRERLLVAFTGPRGVVLVAVAGLFGERLAALGIADGARIGPLAFALVAATVVLHGFTLTPLARALGLTAGATPGVLILGGSRFSVALGAALRQLKLPVMIADPNQAHLRNARKAGIDTFFGDILSEAADDRLDRVAFEKLLCATDNDAYNTLVATDLAPEFGRENVFQLEPVRQSSHRHALPPTLGGQHVGKGHTFFELEARINEGYTFEVSQLTEGFGFSQWREHNPEAIVFADLGPQGTLRLLGPKDKPKGTKGTSLVALTPPAATTTGEVQSVGGQA